MTETQTVQDATREVASAWRRNFEAGADAARAFQAESAQFAGKLLDLNLQAARALGAPLADDRLGAPKGSFPPRRQAPEPGYLDLAEACVAQAAAAPDPAARALHEEECTLWLMLARQRRAIDDVVQTYAREAKPA